LLLLEGTLLQQQGDLRSAEARWLRLLPPLPAVATGDPSVAADDRRAARRHDPEPDGTPPASADGPVPGLAYFASTGSGLRGFATRHRLALLYRAQGRDTDAEAQCPPPSVNPLACPVR
jgi:hypothetical protein